MTDELLQRARVAVKDKRAWALEAEIEDNIETWMRYCPECECQENVRYLLVQLKASEASRGRWRKLARAFHVAYTVLTGGGVLAQCLKDEILKCRAALTDSDRLHIATWQNGAVNWVEDEN